MDDAGSIRTCQDLVPGRLVRAARYRASRHRSAIPGSALRRSALRRSALGSGLAAGLALGSFGGVPGDGDHATTPAAPFITTQPYLADVLLDDRDLPDGYRLASVTAGRRAPATDITAMAAADPAACRALFERPWDLAAAGLTPASDQVIADHIAEDGGAVLRQSLTVLGAGPARRGIERIRNTARHCQEFDATLDDGDRIIVRIRPLDLDPSRIAGQSWALLFSVAGGPSGEPESGSDRGPSRRPDGTIRRTGYLAVARAGGVLATLRHLGPAGVVGADEAADTLARATGKIDPSSPLLRPTRTDS